MSHVLLLRSEPPDLLWSTEEDEAWKLDASRHFEIDVRGNEQHSQTPAARTVLPLKKSPIARQADEKEKGSASSEQGFGEGEGEIKRS